ncbi:MAG TPA: hemolysin family protein [Tepidisphaeraceae bacterium]|jgi:magnesium and cobalt transporter
MPITLNIIVILVSVLCSGLLATLTFSLRDFSRARLADVLTRRGLSSYFDRTVEHSSELAFLTATFRLLVNLVILVCFIELFRDHGWNRWVEYMVAAGCSAVATVLMSVTLPHALAMHVGEPVIGLFVRPLLLVRLVCRPLTAMLRVTESVVRRAATSKERTVQSNEELQSEILAVVQEGEKEGFVDPSERKMIQGVIQFGDATAGQVMTARPAIVSLMADAPLDQVRQTILDSGLSRIPLYEGSLDHVVGVLYARDLIKYVGEAVDSFNSRQIARPAFLVPDTKPLQDLLADFRLQKVHMAIVLDEYGGTAGLVTIEDVLEEIVGDISDEHEPIGPAAFHRVDDQTAEADASIGVEEFNRLFGTTLPEDSGYETLGGFVSTFLGVVPSVGKEFEHAGVTFTVVDAEPQRVKRVRVRNGNA